MAQKTSEQINNEIIQFFINQANRYPQIRRGMIVSVDYGAGGLYVIERLNAIARTIYEDGYPISRWLQFKGVDKGIWFIRDRIDITISMLAKDIMSMNDIDTP